MLTAIGIPLLAITWVGLPETLPPERRHGARPDRDARDVRIGSSPRPLSYAPHAAAPVALARRDAVRLPSRARRSCSRTSTERRRSCSAFFVFAINSAGLVAMSQLAVARGRAARRRRRRCCGAGSSGWPAASSAAFVVTVAHAGLVPLLVPSLFAILTSPRDRVPDRDRPARTPPDQQVSLGGASALLGTGQFGMGARSWRRSSGSPVPTARSPRGS